MVTNLLRGAHNSATGKGDKSTLMILTPTERKKKRTVTHAGGGGVNWGEGEQIRRTRSKTRKGGNMTVG